MAYGQNMNAPMSGLMGLAAMKGRMGDNTLVHVNPMELKTLDALAGPGGLTQNPVTGLPEAFKIKDLLPVLLGVAAPFAPLLVGGSALTGLGAAAAAGAGSAAGTALTGGNREEILLSGLASGLTAGLTGGTAKAGEKAVLEASKAGTLKAGAEGIGQTLGSEIAGTALGSGTGEVAKALGTQTFADTASALGAEKIAQKAIGDQIIKRGVATGLATVATNPALYEIPETKTKEYKLPDTIPYMKREQVASKEDIDEFIRKGGATPQFFNYSPVQIPTQMAREGGDLGEAPVTYMATGGDTSGAGMFTGMVEAPQGDGMSDNVSFEVVGDPQIKQAMLSPDEYVMDAFTVAALGNGSSDAGAEKLDEFRKALREKVYGKEAQPKQVDGAKELSRLT